MDVIQRIVPCNFTAQPIYSFRNIHAIFLSTILQAIHRAHFRHPDQTLSVTPHAIDKSPTY